MAKPNLDAVTSLRLPTSLLDELKAESERAGLTVSDIIRLKLRGIKTVSARSAEKAAP